MGVIVERIGSLPAPRHRIRSQRAQRTAESGIGTEWRLASDSIPNDHRKPITEDPEFLRVDLRTRDRAAHGSKN